MGWSDMLRGSFHQSGFMLYVKESGMPSMSIIDSSTFDAGVEF